MKEEKQISSKCQTSFLKKMKGIVCFPSKKNIVSTQMAINTIVACMNNAVQVSIKAVRVMRRRKKSEERNFSCVCMK